MRNEKTVIIAFGNKAQHGKDTAAKHLMEVYAEGKGINVKRYAFADVLKFEVNEMMLAIADGGKFSHSMAWQILCQRWGVKYDDKPIMDDPLCPYGKQRPFLQFWGEYMRRENPFHWIHKVEERIDHDQPDYALITDMRYWNCACWVKSRNGFTVKCSRIGYRNPNINNEHISEVDLDKWLFDYYITTPKDDLEMNHKLAEAVFENIMVQQIKSNG